MPTAYDSVRRARPLLGTFVEIAVAGLTQSEMNAAVEAAFEAVARVHGLMSFHDRSSDVSRLNARAWMIPVQVHAWTFQVLQSAVDLHRHSEGAFDITIAPVLQDMGLLPGRPCGRLPKSNNPAMTHAIELLSDRMVRFKHPGVRIDLGGIAKGFAVDRAIDALRTHGVPAAFVNAGGDLAAYGPSDHIIDIRDPRAPAQLLCRLGLSNGALASSGGCFDPFVSAQTNGSAVIDPSSRRPPTAVLGATVRAPSCMLADALTKVAMVAGPSAIAPFSHYGASALVVLQNDVLVTSDFRDVLRLAA